MLVSEKRIDLIKTYSYIIVRFVSSHDEPRKRVAIKSFIILFIKIGTRDCRLAGTRDWRRKPEKERNTRQRKMKPNIVYNIRQVENSVKHYIYEKL